MNPRDPTSVRQSVRAALRTHERVVLAVSGGLDSMVLLHAAGAVARPEQLTVASFDHGTGTAATAAFDLVARTAAALGLPFTGGRASASPAHASSAHASSAHEAPARLAGEAALRDARWTFLRGVAAGDDAVVATAHSSDDQVETVLMRILRDAGARGLAALYAPSDVVRPLIRLTRRDLARYARAQGLAWVEDPSNATARYLRNRVRRDLLPALRHVRPGFDDELLGLARKAARWRAEVEQFVANEVSVRPEAFGRGADVCANALTKRSPESLAILWPAIAATAGVTLDRRGTVRLVEFTAAGRVGTRIQLSGGWEVVRSRDMLQLRRGDDARPTPQRLAVSGSTEWWAWSFHPVPNGHCAVSQSERFDGGEHDAWWSWLPADRPLSVRAWEAGDLLDSSAGSPRKVKRCLSDAGITGHERRTWPVVLAGDQVVWIPGVCRADGSAAGMERSGLAFRCDYANR